MNYKTILLLIFAIAITGCEKENAPSSHTHYTISQSLYPYLFDLGSHWVYKKENADNIDSVIVNAITKASLQMSPNVPGQGSHSETDYYNITYLSIPAQKTYTEQLIGYVISRGLLSGGFMFLSSKKTGDKNLNAEIINVFDTLTIENRMYKQVVKMKINKDKYVDGAYQLYFTDSVGLIKKEIMNNDTITETWNLIRFNTKLLKVK